MEHISIVVSRIHLSSFCAEEQLYSCHSRKRACGSTVPKRDDVPKGRIQIPIMLHDLRDLPSWFFFSFES